jgi:hypothetical protein
MVIKGIYIPPCSLNLNLFFLKLMLPKVDQTLQAAKGKPGIPTVVLSPLVGKDFPLFIQSNFLKKINYFNRLEFSEKASGKSLPHFLLFLPIFAKQGHIFIACCVKII